MLLDANLGVLVDGVVSDVGVPEIVGSVGEKCLDIIEDFLESFGGEPTLDTFVAGTKECFWEMEIISDWDENST